MMQSYTRPNDDSREQLLKRTHLRLLHNLEQLEGPISRLNVDAGEVWKRQADFPDGLVSDLNDCLDFIWDGKLMLERIIMALEARRVHR